MIVNIFLFCIVVIGCLFLFYLIIKAAVRDGIMEAKSKENNK
jgi:hypothetical protein